jgi:pimeloyl-ACP methyl ester carboxylesterase
MLIARTGGEKIDCVGTSMGGIIGMLLAAEANPPIRRLVINDIGPFMPLIALKRIGAYVGQNPAFDSVDEVEKTIASVALFCCSIAWNRTSCRYCRVVAPVSLVRLKPPLSWSLAELPTKPRTCNARNNGLATTRNNERDCSLSNTRDLFLWIA